MHRRITFRGYTFKSKHEFAWAQHFDSEELQWEYEPVRFQEGRQSYLPDFALCNRRIFVEIKTERATRLNHFHLCKAPLLIVFGLPHQCYIRFKPAGTDRILPSRATSWSRAYAFAERHTHHVS